jgi:hypothetical protein
MCEEVAGAATCNVSKKQVDCHLPMLVKTMLVVVLLPLMLCHGAQSFDYDYGITLPEQQYPLLAALYVDSETKSFLDNCQKRFASFVPTASDVVSLSLLRPFLSTTSVNGLVGRGNSNIMLHSLRHGLTCVTARQHVHLIQSPVYGVAYKDKAPSSTR